MPVLEFSAFAEALPREGAILGLDPGSKRIGVAVSDVTRLIASPLDTITRTKFAEDATKLWTLYDSRTCAGLVLGLPRNMDGTEGPAAQSARAFGRNLLKLREIPLVFWDERLSTAAVTRTLIEADASRKRRGEVVDKLAATYALQGVLDALQERRLSG
jgi:putative Holliday junction resolvase